MINGDLDTHPYLLLLQVTCRESDAPIDIYEAMQNCRHTP